VGAVITDYPFAFTVAVVATLPTVLIFLFLQRYFVEGVQGFALKG
jgi:ABC-type glycerol-3-phosphate transport system permease component